MRDINIIKQSKVINGRVAFSVCECCRTRGMAHVYEVGIGNNDLTLCENCLKELYKEIDKALGISVKTGDTVWELVCCKDGTLEIVPMVVRTVCEYGSVRWVKGKEPAVWNIYAEGEYTYMYKNFYDIGTTLFLNEEAAKEELERGRKCPDNIQ